MVMWYNNENLKHLIVFMHLGGDNVRPYWDRYYGGAQGVIFVIDSSCDAKTMETTVKEFNRALDNDELEGLPLFVLANFQDVPGARSASDVSGFKTCISMGECNSILSAYTLLGT